MRHLHSKEGGRERQVALYGRNVKNTAEAGLPAELVHGFRGRKIC